MNARIVTSDKELNHQADQSGQASLLRFITAGSVDDGKSTLIGRLLFDSKGIFSKPSANRASRSTSPTATSPRRSASSSSPTRPATSSTPATW
jgi:hypothetical protein